MNPAENYILNQPEPYRSILLHLQVLIELTLPEAKLKYRYGIPYYYLKNKPLCYMNASHKRQFVDLGFAKGYQLTVRQKDLFGGEKRNTVKSLRYFNLSAINNSILVDVLEEAKTLY